jgi:hypothetical protein
MPQPPRVLDLQAQRAAMQKLDFLIGNWAGEAYALRGPGEPVEMIQTEEAQYKLGCLVLLIEGIGKRKMDNAPALQALGLISFDDETATYTMRAFNDGRFLETEVTLLESGPGISWGFTLDDIKTSSTLRIDENGRWTEPGELTIGARPPVKFLELTVSRLMAPS